MPRFAWAAAAAIVALGLLASLAIWRCGGREVPSAPGSAAGTAPAAPPPPAAAPPPAPAIALPPASAAAPAAGAAPPEAGTAWRDPSRLPPKVPEGAAWSEVPLTTRLSALGALAPRANELVQRARDDMDHCFDEPGALNPAPPAGARGPAVLTLHLEARPERLEVVDAPLDRPGTSSDSLVACCQAVLRGASVPVPGLEPGLRYRYQLVLVR